jgi:hypothetical protein
VPLIRHKFEALYPGRVADVRKTFKRRLSNVTSLQYLIIIYNYNIVKENSMPRPLACDLRFYGEMTHEAVVGAVVEAEITDFVQGQYLTAIAAHGYLVEAAVA